MADLFIETVSDLYLRHGQYRQPPLKAWIINNYTHILNTGSIWVVEQDDELVSIAGAIVRDNLWFLSSFWTHPTRQGQGIGGPLLNQLYQQGREQGADTFFVWASIDLPAIACYMKMGMFPGCPIFFMETPAGEPWQIPVQPPEYQQDVLDPEYAMELDQQVRGTRRPQDHAYFSSGMNLRGYVVKFKNEPVGYFYQGQGGLAPIAWITPEHTIGVLTVALGQAANTGSQVRLYVPGHCHQALDYLLGAGLRLTAYAHLLLSRSFGALPQYLPSGPGVY